MQEMLEDEDWATRQAITGLPSGLKLLDSLTGGLHPGEFWVVVGTPGVGRTVLAGQIALQAALERQGTVVFVSGREPSEVILANMVCALGEVVAQHLKAGSLGTEELARIAGASERLSSTGLRLWSMADDSWETSHSKSLPGLALQIGKRNGAKVLIVDDIDALLEEPILDVLSRLREWCRTAQFTLVATLPEELVMERGRLLPEVRREVDIALRLSRPGQFESSPREGEADLHVLGNRTGPIDEIVLAFQGHYRRFHDLGPRG